jgi:hypothetical protein
LPGGRAPHLVCGGGHWRRQVIHWTEFRCSIACTGGERRPHQPPPQPVAGRRQMTDRKQRMYLGIGGALYCGVVAPRHERRRCVRAHRHRRQRGPGPLLPLASSIHANCGEMRRPNGSGQPPHWPGAASVLRPPHIHGRQWRPSRRGYAEDTRSSTRRRAGPAGSLRQQ